MPTCLNSAIFFGWTQIELEVLLAKFKTELTANGPDYITQASVPGKSTTRAQRMPLKDWMRYLRRALRECDPTTYGALASRFTESTVDGVMEK